MENPVEKHGNSNKVMSFLLISQISTSVLSISRPGFIRDASEHWSQEARCLLLGFHCMVHVKLGKLRTDRVSRVSGITLINSRVSTTGTASSSPARNSARPGFRSFPGRLLLQAFPINVHPKGYLPTEDAHRPPFLH